jgi:hypothetical protein
MALNTNFNVNPYYDDYDEDKLFLRMLFKPGYAVQARELTQLQTILQKQTERFGNHVFVNGSLVSGGQTVIQTATYLNVASSYAGTTVDVTEFEGKTIVDNAANPTKRAEIIKVTDENTTTNEPKTFLSNSFMVSHSLIAKQYKHLKRIQFLQTLHLQAQEAVKCFLSMKVFFTMKVSLSKMRHRP